MTSEVRVCSTSFILMNRMHILYYIWHRRNIVKIIAAIYHTNCNNTKGKATTQLSKTFGTRIMKKKRMALPNNTCAFNSLLGGLQSVNSYSTRCVIQWQSLRRDNDSEM
ncbi:hypothetical protein TNCV_3808011 [Trichonephila clavipes]|nr:hypothetical protein TNCV_3808011 [Trichonephila clavipes]